MLASLLMLFLVGFVSLVVLTVVLAVIGGMLSLAGVLLFKVAPVLLLGWVVLKLLDRGRPRGGLSAADRRWLDE